MSLGGRGGERCKLCGRTMAQAVEDAPDLDTSEFGRRIPMVKCTNIEGTPVLCRVCVLRAVEAFATVARGLLKKKG